MPKNPLPCDLEVMDTVAQDMRHFSMKCPELQASSIARYIMQPNILQSSRVASSGEERDLGLEARWLKLKQFAKSESYDVLHGLMEFLFDKGLSQDEVISQLLTSRHIGIQFGKLRSVADDEFATAINTSPHIWFMYDEVIQQADFSPDAKVNLDKYSGREAGCPALSYTFEIGDQKVNMYDIYWQVFTQDFVQTYIIEEEPYVTLRVHSRKSA